MMVDRLSDGFSPPKPRSIAELRADPSLTEDFSEGAFVALIQTGMGDVQPGLGLDRNLMVAVNAAATQSGATVAAFLAAAAREKLAAGR